MARSSNDHQNSMKPVSVSLHVALLPVLDELSKDYDKKTIQMLKDAFTKTEKQVPGFTQEFLNGLLQKEVPGEINFTKSLLRMSGRDSPEFSLQHKEPEFVKLSDRARLLKQILSRIPDEMHDRPRFLQTIKDIASAIKDLLDAVNEVFKRYSSRTNRRALDNQKKEFVKCSKNFSDTLKIYFRDGQEVRVYASANRLIQQANAILMVFKSTSPD